MPDFTALPIPYVPIGTQAAAVRSAIDAAQLSGDNSFGGLQNLAIRGPFLSDAEADANGVPVDNLYYQPNGTVRAASHLSLDLQFATDKTLTARVGPTPTFTRASGATYVGSDGLIQSAAVDEPRFDHDPVTGVCKGLLIEEGRTNVALYSGALVSNTGWTGLLTSTPSGTGPDGNSAYELAEVTASGLQSIANTGGTGIAQATSVISGTTYTGSIFLKKITGSIDWVQITNGAAGFGSSQYANINISNGTIGNSSGGTARVEAYANGWYRVSWTCAAAATALTNSVLVAGIQNTNGTTRLPSYAGSTDNKFLAAMAQFEAGSFPTSYIPTTTGTLARSADVCNITGGDFTSFYNQSEGTIFSQNFYRSNTTGRPFYVGDGTSATNIADVFSGNLNITSNVFSGGAQQYARDVSAASNSSVKIALAIAASNMMLSVGGSLATSGGGLMPVGVDRLIIGNRPDGSRNLNGHIAAIRYYKKRLPDAKLAQLTV